MTLTISLIVTTLLCLAFATTRAFGIVGLFFLLNMYPVPTVTAFLFGCVALYFYHHCIRSK